MLTSLDDNSIKFLKEKCVEVNVDNPETGKKEVWYYNPFFFKKLPVSGNNPEGRLFNMITEEFLPNHLSNKLLEESKLKSQ